MSVMTIVAPLSETADLCHSWCCEEDRAVCGADLTDLSRCEICKNGGNCGRQCPACEADGRPGHGAFRVEVERQDADGKAYVLHQDFADQETADRVLTLIEMASRSGFRYAEQGQDQRSVAFTGKAAVRGVFLVPASQVRID